MLLLVALVAAGAVFLVAGKTLALIIGGGLAVIWLLHELRRFSASRPAVEERRHENSRLIGRGGVPRGHKLHPGWIQKHAPAPWCDGWGAAEGPGGCDGDGEHMSTLTYDRAENAGKPIREQKKKKK